MTPGEARRVSAILRGLPADIDPAADLFVDTFHQPYLHFSQSIVWPSVAVGETRMADAASVAECLAKTIPSLVTDCEILPNPKPSKDSGIFHFVREHTVDGSSFVFMLKIVSQYLGGAEAGEIITPPAQGISPSVRTDRIYFSARILPVERIQRSAGAIVDFVPQRVEEAVFQVSSNVPDRWTTVLFDEIDFSDINKKLTGLFAPNGISWNAGSLFAPIIVDYLTICMNVVSCTRVFVDGVLPFFARAWSAFRSEKSLASLSDSDRAFWQAYYQAWAYERVLSRGGNPHWKFTAHPDSQWIKRFAA